MEFVHISRAQQCLRSYQRKIEEMLRHFAALRDVRGSGIKGGSCCAVTLMGEVVYGNSQAYALDHDAAELGRAHAEIVAYELGAAAGPEPRVLFCELSPVRGMRRNVRAPAGPHHLPVPVPGAAAGLEGLPRAGTRRADCPSARAGWAALTCAGPLLLRFGDCYPRSPAMHAACRALVLVAITAAACPLKAQTFNGRTAAEWVQDLGADDETVRDYAVWALVTMGDRAVRSTMRALDDERPVVRRLAAVALGRLGAEAAIARETLVKLQADAVPDVARAAKVATLRVQVEPGQVPQLVAALQGDDWDLQLAAAEVAQKLGSAAKPAARALVDLLQREGAGLDRTVTQRLPRAPTRYWNVRAAAALALGAIGPTDDVAIVPALLNTASNDSWAARAGAVTALGSFPPDKVTVAKVCEVLAGDAEWLCRRAAAEVLPKLVAPASDLLPDVLPAAIGALRDQDGGVRRLAADFLGGCGAAAASSVPELVHLLGSSQETNREYALKALGGIGPAAATAKDALISCFESIPGDEEWRGNVVLEVLAKVAPEARRELPALEAFLAAREKPAVPPEVVRHEAIVAALAGLQDKDARQRRIALGQVARLRAVEAVPHLLVWLDGDRDVGECAGAVQVLMLLDAAQGIPRFRACLDAPERPVRYAAAQALAMFDDAESRARVVEVLTEDLGAANSDRLVYLGLSGVVELAPALERIVADAAEDPRRRWGATSALGSLNSRGSAPVVAAMLKEVDGNKELATAQRDELLAVGLRVLARLDASTYKSQFAKFVEADETEVRDAALGGMARLGDAAAIAALRKKSPWQSIGLGMPEDLRTRLEATRLRLGEVRGNTLHDVLTRLRKMLDIPIEVSQRADPRVLDGRFGGYIDMVGLRPSALAVLGAVNPDLFSGGTLVPRFHADRIEMLTPEEAGMEKGR